MHKILAVLLLIPSLCLAESMVYVQKVPMAASAKLQGPQAFVEVAGVKVDQPIAITTDGTPVWAVLVTDAQLATISKDAAFLGKGLDAVKVKSPTIYDKLTVDNQAIQTFAGYDPKTGDLEGVKPIADVEKVIIK